MCSAHLLVQCQPFSSAASNPNPFASCVHSVIFQKTQVPTQPPPKKKLSPRTVLFYFYNYVHSVLMEVVIFKILLEGFANFPNVLSPRTEAQSKFHAEGPEILGAALQNLLGLSLLSVSDTVIITANGRITKFAYYGDQCSCITKCTGICRTKNFTCANFEIIWDLKFWRGSL